MTYCDRTRVHPFRIQPIRVMVTLVAPGCETPHHHHTDTPPRPRHHRTTTPRHRPPIGHRRTEGAKLPPGGSRPTSEQPRGRGEGLGVDWCNGVLFNPWPTHASAPRGCGAGGLADSLLNRPPYPFGTRGPSAWPPPMSSGSTKNGSIIISVRKTGCFF